MNFKRLHLVRKAAQSPEFENVPEYCREKVADEFLRKYAKSRTARLLESGFAVCLCLATLLGVTLGYFQWGFWGALSLGILLIFIISGLFALAGHLVAKRRLRQYIARGEFKEILHHND